MKHTLDIAWKDIRQMLRERMSLIFLLVMPILFTLMFGLVFGGSGKAQSDPRVSVGYLDQDGSLISAELKGLLQASTVIRLDETAETAEDLPILVQNKKLSAALIVPAGYGDSLQSGSGVKPILYVDPNTDTGLTCQSAILTAVGKLSSAVKTAQIITNHSVGLFEDNLAQSTAGWLNPPVSLVVSNGAAAIVEEKSSSSGMSASQMAPGMMIQFSMAGLLTAAQVLVHERKSHCMQRLLTTAVARHEILLGHYLAILTTTFVQLLILIAFGQIVLKLDYLRQPLGTLVMTLATALFVAGMGLLVGAIAKTDDQAIIFSLIPMFIFSGLGGAWVSLEVTGKTFQLIGHLTPVAWAMDGYKNIIARGLDLSSIWVPAAALLGYAVLFLGLAAWKFKFE